MPALRAAKGTASEFLGAGQGEGLTLFPCSRSEGVGGGPARRMGAGRRKPRGMAGWGLADRCGAQSHAQGATQKKNMPGRETDRRTGRRGGLAWSRPSNTFCHRETLLLATCWSHWPSCHRGHGSRQVGSIEDPAPAPAGLLGSLLCTESALSQKPEKRRSSHWAGRAGAVSETVPRPHGVSFTSVLTAAGDTPTPQPAPPAPRPGRPCPPPGRGHVLPLALTATLRSSLHLFIRL